jgi:hypothetical protein
VTTWTKDPPKEAGHYWIKWTKRPEANNRMTVAEFNDWGWFFIDGEGSCDHDRFVADSYVYWPIPIPAPEEQA